MANVAVERVTVTDPHQYKMATSRGQKQRDLSSPDTLCYRPHGLLGYKHVTGESVQHRMFGDEAKVAAERRRGGQQDEITGDATQLSRGQGVFHQLFLGWQPQKEMFFIWKK